MYTLLISFIVIFIFKILYHTNKINQIKRAGNKGYFHQFVVSGKYKRSLKKEKVLRKNIKNRKKR